MKTNKKFLAVLMILSMLFTIYERVGVAMAKEPAVEKSAIEETVIQESVTGQDILTQSEVQLPFTPESLLQAGVETILWADIN